MRSFSPATSILIGFASPVVRVIGDVIGIGVIVPFFFGHNAGRAHMGY